MNRSVRVLAGVLVTLVVAGALAFWMLRSRTPRVETVKPTRGEVVQTLAIIGRVAPHAQVRFLAPESTSVMSTPLEVGDHAEAGTLLGIPAGTVKSRLSRARQILQEMLG